MDVRIEDEPEFFPILSDEDKELYKELRNKLKMKGWFKLSNDPFPLIQEYCDHEEKDKWKRCLVCGICWNLDYIAVNYQALSFLLSINISSTKVSIIRLCMRLKYVMSPDFDFTFPNEFAKFKKKKNWVVWKKDIKIYKTRDKEEIKKEYKEWKIQYKENMKALFSTFYDLLSDEDKELYEQLKEKLKNISNLYLVSDIFKDIREYCEHNINDKWKRYLICGVCWKGNYIAIQLHFLSFLFSKEPSTLSRLFRKINMPFVLKNEKRVSFIFEKIPLLKESKYTSLIRSWSLRKFSDKNEEEEEEDEMEPFTICEDFKIQRNEARLSRSLLIGGPPIFLIQFTDE
ncbi:hypothetical protein M9Y10_042868 [Tritrichomonas musculus]|uniref:Initiator binding domain-containing protein n=1 Tax=Tritrichomonas musculus TaxID=1915356 RepID=A0ABR2JY22_9EUKA